MRSRKERHVHKKPYLVGLDVPQKTYYGSVRSHGLWISSNLSIFPDRFVSQIHHVSSRPTSVVSFFAYVNGEPRPAAVAVGIATPVAFRGFSW